MNIRMLKPYYRATELKEEQMDKHMWLMGAYVFDAVSSALSSLFRKKGSAPKRYVEKPYMSEKRESEGNLSHDDIVEKTKMLFRMLSVKQANFELEKKLEKDRIADR